MKNIIWAVIVCAVLPLCACSSVSMPKGGNEVLIRDVPFFPQKDYQCGPASLAGVLRYWGSTVMVEDIASDIFSRSARGTLTMDMLIYAEKEGFDASQYSGSLDDIKTRVRAGYPLIVLVDYGFFVYRVDHFMVVIGFNDDGVVVDSGKSEKAYVSNEDFLKTWKRTNNWTLWIKPKDKVHQ